MENTSWTEPPKQPETPIKIITEEKKTAPNANFVWALRKLPKRKQRGKAVKKDMGSMDTKNFIKFCAPTISEWYREATQAAANNPNISADDIFHFHDNAQYYNSKRVREYFNDERRIATITRLVIIMGMN